MSAFRSIPVIDVTTLLQGDDEGALDTAATIRKAAVETGFFYVSGHNISSTLMNATYMASKYFFSLSEERKREIAVAPGSAHRGYVPVAQTKQPGVAHADMKESFNFAFPFTPEHPAMASGHTLIGINQWPRGEAVWRQIVEAYYAEIFRLGQAILGGFALALDLPRDFFRTMYLHPLVRARLLHYPPQQAASVDQFGAAEHTDYGTITILWQDSVGGLQVKNRSGDWIDAPPLDQTFVINIGDMLALWSNDLFVSTPHRVINTSGSERYSIAVFYDPDYDVTVECLPNCSSPANPARYAPLVAGEYIIARYDGTYAYRQPTKSW